MYTIETIKAGLGFLAHLTVMDKPAIIALIVMLALDGGLIAIGITAAREVLGSED